MKKTPKVTPKELSKRRLAKSKLMKIPNNEGKFSNKENEIPAINTKKKTYKVHDRETKDYNIRNPFDIPDHKRLFSKSMGDRKVKPEPFIMSEPHTICDIDNTFYKIIEGRPLRQLNDVKVYMRNIRDITLYKANAAYLKDQMLQFESSNAFEIEQYEKINKLYENTKMNFVSFAKEGYEKAKAIQDAAEVQSLETAKMTDQLESFSFRNVKLRNQLTSIMFSFETLIMYGKFLNSISPDLWRKEFDNLNVKIKKVFISPSLDKNESVMASSSSISSLSEYKSILAKFKEMTPRLYFKKPKQIMEVYDDICRQCLNYMKINVFASSILNNVQKSRDYLKNSVTGEIDEMEDFLEIYERNVQFMEERENDYKAVFQRLLYSQFQTLYASPDTIKLFTCVQYVNSTLFGNFEDPKDSLTSLMHGLEVEYCRLTSSLDFLDVEVVKAATSQMFAEDIKVMKRANFAQRALKECDILSKALYTSFDPPRTRTIIKAKKDSDSKISKTMVTK